MSSYAKKLFVAGGVVMMATTMAACGAKKQDMTPKEALNEAASKDAHLDLVPFNAPLEGGIVTTTEAPQEVVGEARVIEETTGPIVDPATGKKKRGTINEEEKIVKTQREVSVANPEIVYGAAMMRGQGVLEEGLIITTGRPATKKDIQQKAVPLTSSITVPVLIKAGAVVRSLTGAAYEGTGAYNNIKQGQAADKRVYDETMVVQKGGTQIQEGSKVNVKTDLKTGDVKVNTKVEQTAIQKTEQTAVQAVKEGDTKVVVPVDTKVVVPVDTKVVVPVDNSNKVIVPVQQNNIEINKGKGQGHDQGGCPETEGGCSFMPSRDEIRVLPNGMKFRFMNTPVNKIA